MDKFFGAASRVLREAGAVIREAAHDAAYDLRDNALRGFGLPRLAVSAASLAVAGVAAAGTASVTLELASKVYGTRECRTCNGWECLLCTMCLGSGNVQYSTSLLTESKSRLVESLANAVIDGKEEIIHYPEGYNAGYPLPRKKCPMCNGRGVMKCIECKGDAWRNRFSLNNVMDAPWKTWDAYQKTHPPLQDIHKTVRDPDLAAFYLFERDELEGGFKYDEDAKQRIMTSYQNALEYDLVREEVAKRGPGWEQLQEALYLINPEAAKHDPVIVQDMPYYKARKKLEAEVALLPVPPRPAEWTEKYRPLLKSHWTDEELELAKRVQDVRNLLDTEEKLVDEILDAAWASEWRLKKCEELVHEKIRPYIEAEETGKSLRRLRDGSHSQDTKGGASVAAAKQVESKVAQKPSKSEKADQKKRERQERLAKQAAEREAALSKAKRR